MLELKSRPAEFVSGLITSSKTRILIAHPYSLPFTMTSIPRPDRDSPEEMQGVIVENKSEADAEFVDSVEDMTTETGIEDIEEKARDDPDISIRPKVRRTTTVSPDMHVYRSTSYAIRRLGAMTWRVRKNIHHGHQAVMTQAQLTA